LGEEATSHPPERENSLVRNLEGENSLVRNLEGEIIGACVLNFTWRVNSLACRSTVTRSFTASFARTSDSRTDSARERMRVL